MYPNGHTVVWFISVVDAPLQLRCVLPLLIFLVGERYA
jgi:hypothetical protein